MKIITAFLTLLLVSFTPASTQTGDEFCGGIRNSAWQTGESIKYNVYYTLAGVYVNGGEANFNINLERYNGKPVYHIIGEGKTNSFFDGLFKVRDKYESFIDTNTLQPYKFIRNILEGDFKTVEYKG
mgnify:FL=1